MLVIFAFYFLAIHAVISVELLQKQFSLWLLSGIAVVNFQSKLIIVIIKLLTNTVTPILYSPQFHFPRFPIFLPSESSRGSILPMWNINSAIKILSPVHFPPFKTAGQRIQFTRLLVCP